MRRKQSSRNLWTDRCLFGELLSTVECSRKLSKHLLSVERVGWNHNGAATGSEAFSSSAGQWGCWWSCWRQLTLGSQPARKNSAVGGGFLLSPSFNSKSKVFRITTRAPKTISSLMLLNTRISLNDLPRDGSSMFSQFRNKWLSW